MLRRSPTAHLPLLLGVGVVLLVCLGASRQSLAAAALRNSAGRELVRQVTDAEGACAGPSLAPIADRLEKAMRFQPEAGSSWRMLLRVKGLVDRTWIGDLDSEVQAPWAGEVRQAMTSAANTLLPTPWAMQESWTTPRCLNTWGSWTLGSLWATSGQWERAVAAYQAGLGLAPGRVPPEILEEYYLALARHTLSTGLASTRQELAAAKYLALAGETAEADAHLQSLGQAGPWTAQQRCEIDRWREWLRQAQVGTGLPPPGPATYQTQAGTCLATDGRGFTPQPGWTPEWVLPASQPVTNPATAERLMGFDLDPDVLEAGGEVLGTLYWQRTDGRMVAQDFRGPNLWPNSGNSWLRLEGFSTCLPGYSEPPWVSPCASDVSHDSLQTQIPNPVGQIHVPTAKGPDTFIGTASVTIPLGRPMVYGGRWRVDGDLPQAHLARYGGDKRDLRAYYETVLNLRDLPQGEWQSRAGVTPALSWEQEFEGWIRPETDVGYGDLKFDELFGFVLPAD